MLCSSPISHPPHIHWLIYQVDDNSDADTNDPPNQPNNETVVGLQHTESLTQVEVPCQPDNHDSIQELADVAQSLMVSNEFVFQLYFIHFITLIPPHAEFFYKPSA